MIGANSESLRPAHQAEPWLIITQWLFSDVTVGGFIVDLILDTPNRPIPASSHSAVVFTRFLPLLPLFRPP